MSLSQIRTGTGLALFSGVHSLFSQQCSFHHPFQVEVKLIVDRGFMGQIVGKGGSHVTQIRAETGASINTTPPTTRSPLVADAEQLIKVCLCLCAHVAVCSCYGGEQQVKCP